MTEITEEHIDDLIFSEMMVHPVLFTHPNPKKILFLGDHHLILREILKHNNVIEIHHNDATNNQISNQKFIFNTDISSLISGSFDVIINASDFYSYPTKQYFDLLNKNGILIQQSVSPFATHELKAFTYALRQIGFNDVQLLSFPQPNYSTGWRSILMALKHGMFKRLREKIIYNRSFKTAYYNFDIHKAATVLPEFIKNSNLFNDEVL